MVNIGLNIGIDYSSTPSGMLQILMAFGYLAISVFRMAATAKSAPSTPGKDSSSLILQAFKAVVISIILFLSGIIFILNGWRVDPILRSRDLVLTFLLMYLMFKDLVSQFIRSR